MPTTDRQFEATFSDLAYSVLKDVAPALFDYLVGFQVLDVNDDQTHALGVFGCKVGDDWVYLPVFFHNGELKGKELMYIKEQDMFLPLAENWIGYVLHRRPYILGEQTDETRRDLSNYPPDLTSFVSSPMSLGKHATADPLIKIWCADNINPVFQPFVEAMKRNPVDDPIYKAAAERLTLPNFLANTGPTVHQEFLGNVLKHASTLGEAVVKVYPEIHEFTDPNFTDEARRVDARIRSEKRAKVKVEFDASKDVLGVSWKKGPATQPDVKVFTSNDLSRFGGDNHGLSAKELERLARGELVIKDHRNNTSKVVRGDLNIAFTVPDSTNFYHVLTGSYEVAEYLVIKTPLTIGEGRVTPQVVTVVDLDNSNQSGNVDGTQMMAEPNLSGLYELQKRLDTYDKATQMKVGESYVLVTAAGKGTIPFKVLKKEDGTRDSTIFWVADHSSVDGGSSGRLNGRVSIDHKFRPTFVPRDDVKTDDKNIAMTIGDTIGVRKIVVLKDPGGLRNFGDTLFVTNNAAAVPVKFGLYSNSVRHVADVSDIQQWLIRNPQIGSVTSLRNEGGDEYSVKDNEKTAQVNRTELVRHLVVDHGMSEKDASDVLGGLRRSGDTVDYTVFFSNEAGVLKRAAPPTWLENNTNAPSIPDPTTYSDPRLGVTVQPHQAGFMPVKSMNEPQNNRQIYSNTQTDQPLPWELASTAGKTNQREVFDPGLIGSLIKVVDSDSLVDKYIGDLMLALDRIGRILFLYYQHNDHFREQYGEEDQTELEDSLRNIFKSLGELVLFLKRRSVKSDPEDEHSGTDLTNIAT